MNDTQIIWEAPAIIKPEFRLYYDDRGQVLFYTCEKPEGKYIVIDAMTYAAGRPDIRVIDNKISTVSQGLQVSKLVPGYIGVKCASEDISIVAQDKYKGKTTIWELKTHEL